MGRSRLEARRAESKAINDEVPLFNRVDAEAWGAVDPERGAKYVEEHGLPDVPVIARGAGFRRAYVVRTEAVARIRGVKAQPWPVSS